MNVISMNRLDMHCPLTKFTTTTKIETIKSTRGHKRMLPQDFIPTPHSVICGRRKECFDAVGNRRLRIVISMFLKKYSEAKSKVAKSVIVSTVLDMIYDATPQGAFVKYENGRWYELDEDSAREKTGALFRDCLHTQYRSSAKAKHAKRKASAAAKSMNNDSSNDVLGKTTFQRSFGIFFPSHNGLSCKFPSTA